MLINCLILLFATILGQQFYDLWLVVEAASLICQQVAARAINGMVGMPFYFCNQHVSEALIDTTAYRRVICSAK